MASKPVSVYLRHRVQGHERACRTAYPKLPRLIPGSTVRDPLPGTLQTLRALEKSRFAESKALSGTLLVSHFSTTVALSETELERAWRGMR